MSHHSVADAKTHLSDLINRSMITRHGQPVVELRAVKQITGQRMTQEGLAWLAAHRVDMSSTLDADTLISQVRDEDKR